MKVIACSDLWVQMLRSPDIDNLEPKHLLWGLFLLKVYATESVAAGIFGTTEKTYRQRVRQALAVISSLDVICFKDRWINWDHHKFNKAGLRYEFASALGCSQIVHVEGGVPCVDWPDLKLARSGIIPRLDPDEKVAADKGYCGDPHFICPIDNNQSPEAKAHNKTLKRMGARHETANKRLKDFSVLRIWESQVFFLRKKKYAQECEEERRVKAAHLPRLPDLALIFNHQVTSHMKVGEQRGGRQMGWVVKGMDVDASLNKLSKTKDSGGGMEQPISDKKGKPRSGCIGQLARRSEDSREELSGNKPTNRN
ncbi:hypothetical protein DFJ73DRAFT_949407 [Zopfochytrium polystomum]|nr:hypothetical protein DFJ73DRAFT_949407 [Zopfochytrium polystomum]